MATIVHKTIGGGGGVTVLAQEKKKNKRDAIYFATSVQILKFPVFQMRRTLSGTACHLQKKKKKKSTLFFVWVFSLLNNDKIFLNPVFAAREINGRAVKCIQEVDLLNKHIVSKPVHTLTVYSWSARLSLSATACHWAPAINPP